MAREFGSQGIHIAHIVIDGQINTPRVQATELGREAHTLLARLCDRTKLLATLQVGCNSLDTGTRFATSRRKILTI
jgi:hypothetical protein